MALNAPASAPVETLLATHPQYDAERSSDLWRLYAGGKHFDPRRFILQRRREPDDVFEERLKRAFYCGYLGQIVDYFVANLFLGEPSFSVEDQDTLPDYYAAFAGNCNGSRMDFGAFQRDRWTRALVQQTSYTWVDLPPLGQEEADAVGPSPTKQRLDDVGARAAYLIPVNALELLDYQLDGQGNFRWVMIHQEFLSRSSPFDAERELRHRWTVLDREEFAVFEATEELKQVDGHWRPADSKAFRRKSAAQTRSGSHSFGQVPLVELCMPDALGIGDKLFDLQRALTEHDCAIRWQQLMSLFAMPVIKTAGDFSQTMGEAYYLKLMPGDEASWMEPAGTAMVTSMQARAEMKEEMFRVSHQMAQAIQSTAQTAGRSGESKRRDQNATEIILGYLGALARDHALEILRLVARARQEELTFSVDGFDEFDVEDLETFLANQASANLLPIHSQTYQRQNEKAVVRKMHPEFSAEMLTTIDAEIDAAEIPMPGEELLGAPGGMDPSGGTEEDE